MGLLCVSVFDKPFFCRPENPSPIVLYGSSRRECIRHTEWLANKLEKLQTDRKTVATIQQTERTVDEERYDPFEQFCHTIADRVQEIWILKGGYDAFCSEYEFLCGHVTFESMFPLPHQITQNLYLGSRVVPLQREVLSQLKITHLIVSASQRLDWAELQGVSVLQCEVEDRNNQEMFPCWRACDLFINEALSQVGLVTEGDSTAQARVLVLLHGRSRSTSVILAYLMKKLRIGFEEAWTMVRKNCWHLIDRSLVYEDQLNEWGKQENKSIQ